MCMQRGHWLDALKLSVENSIERHCSVKQLMLLMQTLLAQACAMVLKHRPSSSVVTHLHYFECGTTDD